MVNQKTLSFCHKWVCNISFEKMKKQLLHLVTIALLASLGACSQGNAGVVSANPLGNDSSSSNNSQSTSTDTSASGNPKDSPTSAGAKVLDLKLGKTTMAAGTDFYDGCSPVVRYFDGFDYIDLKLDDATFAITKGDATFGIADILEAGDYKVVASYLDGTLKASATFTVVKGSTVIAKEGSGYFKAGDFSSYSLMNHTSIASMRHRTLSSIGEQKILVVPVCFSDPDYDSFSEEELANINKAYNGDPDETGWQSVRSYYKASSYGKLNLTATIAPVFKFENTSKYFQGLVAKDYYQVSSLILSITESLASKMDLSQFDQNGDGYIDAFEMVYKNDTSVYKWDGKDGSETFAWRNFSDFCTNDSPSTSHVNVGLFLWSQYALCFPGYYHNEIDAHTLIHETGHILGLDDYYSDSYDDLPLGGVDMMDHKVGDHNAFSKMLLGWASPKVVDGSLADFSISLSSFEKTGDCLLVRDTKIDAWNGMPYDEYLLLQYYTPTGLNEKDSAGYGEWSGENYGHGGTYAKAGLEVFHVDARLISDFKTTSGRPNFAYTDNLTKYSYIAASNSGTRSIDVEGSANAKRWVSGSDNRLIKILPATGINTFYSKKNNIFDNFGNEQNLFGLPAYGCGAKTYTNYAMRKLFPNGATFDDGTSLNYSFTVTGQTDEDITLHFLAN